MQRNRDGEPVRKEKRRIRLTVQSRARKSKVCPSKSDNSRGGGNDRGKEEKEVLGSPRDPEKRHASNSVTRDVMQS